MVGTGHWVPSLEQEEHDVIVTVWALDKPCHGGHWALGTKS